MVKPTKKQIELGTYKKVRGEWYKLCTGPAHDKPEYLPATEKYFYVHKSGSQKGRLVSRCRLCINWDKVKFPSSYSGGLVPVRLVQRFFIEATNRIGVAELSRRTGVSPKTIQKGIKGGEGEFHKHVVRRIMLELTSMQRKNENDINAYSKWRQERRLASRLKRCSGCGGLQANLTKGCGACLDRFRGQWRSGKITFEEWKAIQAEYNS